MTAIGSKGTEDAFGKLIADSTKNKADIASHYNFSPERWRYYREDTGTGTLEREFIQYGETTGFNDNADSFSISPPTNGVADFRTAERFRYVVGYVSEVSFAFQLNQSLQSGDKVVIGYGDPDLENGMADADGYMLEFEPGLADNEAYFSMYRNGSVVSNGGSRTLVQLDRFITDWRRFAIDFNWYNVGNAVLVETYTSGGEQLNPTQAKIAADSQKGPESGNQRLHFSILDGGNGLTMETGSAGVLTKGDVSEIRRLKGLWYFGETIGTANTWVPLSAFRISPDDPNVSMDMSTLELLNFSASDDAVLITKTFDETKVTFTGGDSWSPPEHITGTNSAIEERTDVDTYADNTGTLVSNTTTPGGYKISRSVRSSQGTGQSSSVSVAGSDIDLKRSVYDGDIAVILGRSATTGDVDYEFSVGEDW